MFHLWIGIMAGVLLAYLWMRAHARYQWTPWQSWRWWLAGLTALILISPVLWELVRTAFGSFGPLEALKTVLLPWAAGVGFGIWIYLAIGPLPLASTGARPALNGRTDDAATDMQRDLSFIPIAVALLFMTVIVSDQQYGWLSRLQKLTLSGSGVEFAPSSAAPIPRTNYSAAPHATGQGPLVTGEGRISDLVAFMSHLEEIIYRDLRYFVQSEFKYDSADFIKDVTFARWVVKPLGEHLNTIHQTRGYNNLGLLIERPLVDTFRSFVLSQREGVASEERQRLTKEVRDLIIMHVWPKVCQTEATLLRLEIKEPRDKCEEDKELATQVLDLWLSPQEGVALNRDLPYGTLLAAMFLSASDEVDLAVKDLDQWVVDNWPGPDGPPDRHRQWFGVYRALYQSTLLLMDGDLSELRQYLIVEHNKKLVEIGERILTNAFPSDHPESSWRTQIKRIEKHDGIDPIWELGICSNDLSPEFKTFFSSTLSASNNFAFFLSQNIELAERENLTKDMERRANFLANKINMRCLLQGSAADQQQASFLDTAAAVELALARQEKLRPERRRRLCDSYKYADRATKLYETTLSSGEDSPLPTAASGWEKMLDHYRAIEQWTSFKRRLEDVQDQLSYANIEC